MTGHELIEKLSKLSKEDLDRQVVYPVGAQTFVVGMIGDTFVVDMWVNEGLRPVKVDGKVTILY